MNAAFAILGVGGMEMIVVFVAVLLLFGPKKLPELARGLGKGIREFKKASNEVTEELNRAVEEEPPAPRTKLPPEGSASEPEHSVPHSSDQPKPPQ
jgi:TatA/E family protein of Tat protein translocase